MVLLCVGECCGTAEGAAAAPTQLDGHAQLGQRHRRLRLRGSRASRLQSTGPKHQPAGKLLAPHSQPVDPYSRDAVDVQSR